MTDGDYVRSQVRQAAEKLRQAGQQVKGSEGFELDNINVALTAAIVSAESAASIAQQAAQMLEEAKTQASIPLVGTSGTMVMQALSMVSQAEVDQTDMVAKMNHLKQELETLLSTVLNVAITDKDNDASKVFAAASHLDNYAATIP